MKETFERLTQEIEKDLEKIELEREEIIRKSRNIIREATKVINFIHQWKLEEAKKHMETLVSLKKELKEPSKEVYDYISGLYKICLQEYVEASIFFFYTKEKRIPGWEELKVPKIIWVFGLLDFLGEMTRRIYDLIILGEKKKAEEEIRFFEKVFVNLEPLSRFKFVDNLRVKIDGLRRKLEELKKLYVEIKLGKYI